DSRTHPAASFRRAGDLARYRVGSGEQRTPGRIAVVRRLLVHDARGGPVCVWLSFGSARARGVGAGGAAVSACFGLSATDSHLPDYGRVLSSAGLRWIGRPHDRLDRALDSVAAVVLVSGAVSAIERIDASGA